MDFKKSIWDNSSAIDLSNENFRFLAPNSNNKTTLYIGHKGWNDRTFIGKVYPPRTKKLHFLKHYAAKFNYVLANSTKFGLPHKSDLEDWYQSTPQLFKFSIIAPQYLTHSRNLNDVSIKRDLDIAIESLATLKGKLSSLYFNFPSALDQTRIEEFFEFIIQFPSEIPVTVNFRNTELVNNKALFNEILNRLAELKISLVACDQINGPELSLTPTTNNLHVHFIGINNDLIDFKRIELWSKRIELYAKKGIKTVYFTVTQPSPQKFEFEKLIKHLSEQISIDLKNNVFIP